MFERYTEKARRVIFFARYEASRLCSGFIEAEHILLAVLREDRELAAKFLPAGAAESIRKRVEEHTPTTAGVSTALDLPLSAESKRVLAFASEEADRLADKHIRPEYLFLALLREKSGFAAELLAGFGLEERAARVQIAAWDRGRIPPGERGEAAPASGNRHAAQLLGQGRLWRERLLRKSHGLDRMFSWERTLSKPRDALVKKGSATRQMMLYTGQPYDPAEFDLVKGAWKHDYCALWYHPIYLEECAEKSFGYTNGQEWLCERCYLLVMDAGS